MKNHSVTVSIVSESDGAVNQEILLKEYARSPDELVMKNFAITDALIPALNEAMKSLAAAMPKGQQGGDEHPGQGFVR